MRIWILCSTRPVSLHLAFACFSIAFPLEHYYVEVGIQDLHWQKHWFCIIFWVLLIRMLAHYVCVLVHKWEKRLISTHVTCSSLFKGPRPSLLTTVTAHSPPSAPYSFPPCPFFSHPSPKPHPPPCPTP